ncbi:acyl-CoA Delta(11) desaturase-like [Bicyclus anynana]|uniref:Acyl-CoA Delta(11) desaturase-like n=1 Tax=Bicyclus anynana TaxID=110368 RepID=A0ABM3M1J9_BICAN|nr:acyl-CoA Delta(11) desaturase-like [Bicyclus anynana]XP_052745291.1 acyl-CoA Delta(11) desaturase-like [Bicyclus anynana]
MTAIESKDELLKPLVGQAPRKYEILYLELLMIMYIHIAALYGIYLAYFSATWKTLIFHYIMSQLVTLGITAGRHRLWSHNSYKAKMPLQIILVVLSSMTYQYSVIHWVRDHRLHHRYCDTDADPHNASRGFFFSHIGWLIVKRHPEAMRRGKAIDISDALANPVLRFENKYALPIAVTFSLVLPTLVPMYFFGENLSTAWHINMTRLMCNLHLTFSINSFVHLSGARSYDKQFSGAQSTFWSILTLGESFHNYHHTFPWDYRTAELGNNWLNPCTKFIDFFAWLGWAYDLKTVSVDMAQSRARKTGDGTDKWGFKTK